MAKKKAAKKRSAGKAAAWKKLSGMTFCFGGRWGLWEKESFGDLLSTAGGEIVDEVTQELDYVVVDSDNAGTTSTAEKRAIRLNANAGISIQVIDENAVAQLALPTHDEAIAMLSAGEEGISLWNEFSPFYHRTSNSVDLTGVALPNMNLANVRLTSVTLDGVNLTGADLSNSHFGSGNDLCLDRAVLRDARVKTLEHCSAKRLVANEAHFDSIRECNLDGAVLEEATIHDLQKSSLKRADCRKLCIHRYGRKLPPIQSDFAGADLSNAELKDQDLSDSSFCRAKLVQANLCHSKLRNADLSKADLRNARLIGADLTNAKVDGANFEGAILVDARLTGVDCSKATGLDPRRTKRPASGPALRELEKVAKKASVIRIKAEVALDDGYVAIETESDTGYFRQEWRKYVPGSDVERGCDGAWQGPNHAHALLEMAHLWQDGTLRLDSIKVSSSKSPVKGKQLKDIAVAACREAFGINLADEEEAKPKASQLRKELLEELLGKGGVKKFNAHTQAEIAKVGSFRKTDLAGARLNGVTFPIMDLQAANFEGTALSKSQFEQCKCDRANFKTANLQTAHLATSRFNAADFTDANLAKANLAGCSLRKARFNAANLAGANLTGADFTSADLKGAKLSEARFDETTKFPRGYNLPTGMDWRGKGANPALQVRKKKVGSLSIEDFMERLGESVDAQRLKKAVTMLKADRFQLYVQMDDDHLVGVVKSQTDKKLVYSCQLKRDGAFACCTQNLNVCGGLRGALCKHLLVLIVGLTKTGDIDAAEIDNWIAASKAHKPALDKDVMSETLLRYKGAEAGEIDWRPTETVPEDYYAF